MTTSKRIFYVDALKTLAAFMIVLYHFSEYKFFDFGFVKGETYIPGINKCLLGLCCAGVPIFFLVNGLVTLNRPVSLKKTIFKILNILKVYYFWGIIIFFLLPPLKKFDTTALLNAIQNNLWYFWFFKTLIILYIFNYIRSEINVRFREKIDYFVVSTLIIFPFCTNLYWVLAKFLYPEIEIPSWGRTGLFTLYSLVYYLSGNVFKFRIPTIICILFIIAGLGLNTFEVYVYTNSTLSLSDNVNSSFPTIGALLITLGLWKLAVQIIECHYHNAFIEWIGRNSLGIYIFHIPIIAFIRVLYPDTMPFFVGILVAFIIMLLAASINTVLKKVPYINFLLRL